MTERHSDESFYYKLPIYDEGKYTLILKFCELYFKEKNKRKMNI